jgi:hypothetical protein
MRPLPTNSDHELRRSVEIDAASIRSLDAATVCSLWARRLLETGDLSPREKQNLRDICRQHRQAATNRSSFATLLDLSHRAADVSDAVYGLTLTRVGILGRSDYRLPCPEHAHVAEEATNHAGNLAQLEHKQRRSRSTLEALVVAMQRQQVASETLADAEVGAFRNG